MPGSGKKPSPGSKSKGGGSKKSPGGKKSSGIKKSGARKPIAGKKSSGYKQKQKARDDARKKSAQRKRNNRDKSGKRGGKRDRGGKKKKKLSFIQRIQRRFQSVNVDDIVLSEASQEASDSLMLGPRELRKIKNAYDEIDVDGSGEIDYDEFMDFLDDTRSPFTDAVFAMVDKDGNGVLDFDEFLQALSTYCMFNKDQILKFCFETFDADKSGTIEEDEFMAMCSAVSNSDPTFPGNFKAALERFDTNDDGLIDFDEFKLINSRYPLVLFPAFRLQDKMQRKTLGESYWFKVARIKAKNEYIEEYKRTHDGAPPPRTFWEKIWDVLLRRKPYETEGDKSGSKKRKRKSKKGKKKKKKDKKK